MSGASKRLLSAVGTAAVLTAGVRCSSSLSAATHGSALTAGRPLTVRITVTPGDVWLYMIAAAKNGSSDALELQRVDLLRPSGPGQAIAGPARVAPFPADPEDQPHGWTPSGIFKTNPPTLLIPGGNCNVQELDPVHGYQIEPGDEVRFAFVMFSHAPGTTTIPGFRVTYTLGGTTFEQSFPTSLVVTSRDGRPLPMGYSEKPCAHLAQLLPSGA